MSKSLQLLLAWVIILMQSIQLEDYFMIVVSSVIILALIISWRIEKRISQTTGEK